MAAVLLACGAPSTYMESTTQMPMGPGRFFVTVDVNEHTPKATALQYLHQAAYSLGALVVCNTPRTRATTAAPGAGQ